MFVCLDIDECSSSSPVCDINANCFNTRGSYYCTCKAGYSGDGKNCKGSRKYSKPWDVQGGRGRGRGGGYVNHKVFLSFFVACSKRSDSGERCEVTG